MDAATPDRRPRAAPTPGIDSLALRRRLESQGTARLAELLLQAARVSPEARRLVERLERPADEIPCDDAKFSSGAESRDGRRQPGDCGTSIPASAVSPRPT